MSRCWSINIFVFAWILLLQGQNSIFESVHRGWGKDFIGFYAWQVQGISNFRNNWMQGTRVSGSPSLGHAHLIQPAVVHPAGKVGYHQPRPSRPSRPGATSAPAEKSPEERRDEGGEERLRWTAQLQTNHPTPSVVSKSMESSPHWTVLSGGDGM